MLITTSFRGIMRPVIRRNLTVIGASAGVFGVINLTMLMVGKTPPEEMQGFWKRLHYRLPKTSDEFIGLAATTAKDCSEIVVTCTASTVLCAVAAWGLPVLFKSRLFTGPKAWKLFNKAA